MSVTNQIPPAVETVWLDQISNVASQDHPQGKIILITMVNGRRYAIPAIGEVGAALRKVLSPITIASKMPTNGLGA